MCVSCLCSWLTGLIVLLMQYYINTKVYTNKCMDNQACKLFTLIGGTVTSNMLTSGGDSSQILNCPMHNLKINKNVQQFIPGIEKRLFFFWKNTAMWYVKYKVKNSYLVSFGNIISVRQHSRKNLTCLLGLLIWLNLCGKFFSGSV